MAEDRDLLEVMNNIGLAKAFCKDWHNNIKQWRRLYNFDHYNYPPKPGESQFQDPSYTNTVDLAVGIFQANAMVWKVSGWQPSLRETQYSEKVEKLLEGIISANSDRNEYDIRYEVDLHFTRDSAAVLYTVVDPDVESHFMNDAEGQVIEGYDEPPIRTQVIDPLKILMLPGGGGRWKAIMRCEDRTVYDVETQYGIKVKKYIDKRETDKLNIKGEFVDYWDIVYRADVDIDEEGIPRPNGKRKKIIRNARLYMGEVVKPITDMDGYSELPFDIDFFKPTSRDSAGGWHSILTPMISSIKELERSINHRQRQIDMYTGLPLVAKTNNNRKIVLDPGMGEIVNLNTDEDFGFPQWPGNAPDVMLQMNFFSDRAHQSGFSSVVYGSGPSQVSGYALSQMSDQSRIRLEQPITHMEMLWSRWARKVIKLTRSFFSDSAIHVYGQIRGSDFVDYVKGNDLDGFHVVCKIQPEFPAEKTRKHAMATQVRGILSEHTIMQEYLDIQQPDEERKRKLIEMAQSNPIAMQYAMIVNLREMAAQGDEAAAMTLQSVLAQMNTGAQIGRPEEPTSPEQMVGMPSPTGALTPQEQGGMPAGQDEADIMQNMMGAAPNLMGGI